MDKCMSFNIDEDYKTFIEKLRKHVLMYSKSHRMLVLMESLPHLNWLDVELIAGDSRITLRLDPRTLYVRAYSRKVDNFFWEFYDKDTPQIPGSQILGYSGSYVACEHVQNSYGRYFGSYLACEHVQNYNLPWKHDGRCAGGLTDVAGIARELLVLGYHPLHNAICNLAVMDRPHLDQAQSAKSLLTIIQMITEAARIESIAEHIIQNWYDAKPIRLVMLELENAWGTLYLCDVIDSSYMRGMVNIEYVCVKSIVGNSPVKLYGTVMIQDSWDIHEVYKRSSNNAESVGQGDYVSLTGPYGPINGDDPFIIIVSLWDHNIVLPDNEIAEGDIMCNPLNGSPCDVTLVKEVWGDYGKVSVAYSVISWALSTTFNVVVYGAGKSPVDMYGTIKATIKAPKYRRYPEYNSSRTLFDKSKDEYLQVRHQEQFISLTRPVFPVPANSYITVRADLRARDSLPHHEVIAGGSVQFIPTWGTQPFKFFGCGRGVAVGVSISCV